MFAYLRGAQVGNQTFAVLDTQVGKQTLNLFAYLRADSDGACAKSNFSDNGGVEYEFLMMGALNLNFLKMEALNLNF